MHAYETMFLLNPSLSEEEYEAMVNRFAELIQSNGGEVTKTDRMGRRRLAYEIEGSTRSMVHGPLFPTRPVISWPSLSASTGLPMR